MSVRGLERGLGLYAVLTVSMGAMIGSGIFVLPGLAAKIAGPGVMLAYLLAGVVVLPAALSQSEMATAMPESGGTYLYVDRALGPMLGTIAGIGVWFSLVLKSAFALVGLGAYLLLFTDLPTRPVALALAVGVVAVNMLGVKQTGRLQAVVVTVVLGVLVTFVLRGAELVDPVRYEPLLPHGVRGLLAATGFVFVSYAGVTKIASVAEEVRAPGRTIPLGILLSIVTMMAVYTGLMYVLVGTTPAQELHGTLAPMALSARDVFGLGGEILIAVTAVLALTSMANAGVLSSSRYPFAMARGALAPELFARVHPRFHTPVAAIAVTGAAMIALIAFVPVVDLAKLASAFQILVLCFVNLALIAFREADLPGYRPAFRAPGYPWVQLLGIVAGLTLITQMGLLSMAGAAGIVAVGLVWFRAYGRPRTAREGVALEALRRSTDATVVGHTQRALHVPGRRRVLLPLGPTVRGERAAELVRFAARLCERGDSLRLVLFEQVPEQIALSAELGPETTAGDAPRALPPGRPPRRAGASEGADGVSDHAWRALEAELERHVRPTGARAALERVVTHDWKSSLATLVRSRGSDLVITDEIRSPTPLKPLSRDSGWLMEHCGADVAVLGGHPAERLREVLVMGTGGPFDAVKVDLAARIARAAGARIRFLHVVRGDATRAQLDALEAYHADLAALCSLPTSSDVRTAEDREAELVRACAGADLAILGATVHRYLRTASSRDFAHRLAARLPCPVLLVHAHRSHRRTLLGAVLERVAYRA